MHYFDSVLRMYAETGLRTSEGWLTLGRDIAGEVKPRLDTLHNGSRISLYSRDQTSRRVASARRLPH